MRIFIFALFSLMSVTVFSQKIKVLANETTGNIDILIDNKLFTSYFIPGEDILKKPVLYPIKTANGTNITRGWPIDPRPGERIDHPHHVGMWFNYEDLNGFDYWNNSTAISPEKRFDKYGTIKHVELMSMKSGGKKASLKVKADWVSADGKGESTIDETTEFYFYAKGDIRIIDRVSTLRAERTAKFKDVKDGMFAIRVARELEHPSKTPDIFTDANGIETKVPVLNNEGVTGNYRNSEGVEGETVWGKRAKWVNLRGKIKDENISVAIIDHSKNLSYPSYWHARGYGLFAVNPLGANIFSNGKEATNLSMNKGDTITFRYRTIISSHHLSDAEMNKLAAEFNRTVK